MQSVYITEHPAPVPKIDGNKWCRKNNEKYREKKNPADQKIKTKKKEKAESIQKKMFKAD